MSTQFLFAYGTLKSDQPEHSQHCIPPLSITPARALGTLWKIREGYPLMQIDPSIVLLDATKDMSADWQSGREKATRGRGDQHDGNWIQGELFEYPLDPHTLQKMDTWENFVPGIKSPYQRRIIWVKDETGADRIAWAYVCYTPPDWAVQLSENRWGAKR